MGLFDRLGDRLRDIKDDYDTQNAEETALLEEERKLIKDYSLKRTGQRGRYLVDGDHVIEVNLRSPASIQATRDALDEYQRSPKIRKVSKKQAKEFTEGAKSRSQSGPGINFNVDIPDAFRGPGTTFNYPGDFGAGKTQKPQKKGKKGSKKK
jgi:hypothetical protein